MQLKSDIAILNNQVDVSILTQTEAWVQPDIFYLSPRPKSVSILTKTEAWVQHPRLYQQLNNTRVSILTQTEAWVQQYS